MSFRALAMSLDLPQLLQPVDRLGAFAARRAQEAMDALPAARASLLAAAGAEPAALDRKIRAAGPGWRGARPTDEPLDAAFSPPPHPDQLHVLGADGSQVYPDRHAPAYYYLINIGRLHLRYGSGEPPIASTQPAIYFLDEDLSTASGAAIDTALIHTRRDVAEMLALADLAGQLEGEPGLALLDNGLILWQASQEHHAPRPEVRALLETYLQALDRLRATAVAPAGFINRPRNVNLLSLLALSQMPQEKITPENARRLPPGGLTDRRVMQEVLADGQRSARFIPTSSVHTEFASRGHEVHAFYLRTGGDVARVEVPAWVGEDAEALGRVHAGIVEQCRVTGIPYVLVRAHELAVVGGPDREALDQLVAAGLTRHGLIPETSQKARTKRWTASRRRHIVG
jgi:hypothetical protein